MISIFVMYSSDRKAQLDQMVECMKDMELYSQCQKIILVDGEINVDFPEWETYQVLRQGNAFNWSQMWETGVEKSVNDVILYLDSDRILPNDYLTLVLSRIEDNAFLFSPNLFNFKVPVETNIIKQYRDQFTPQRIQQEYDLHKNLLWYDPRYRLPCEGPGKGVMSGNTAFTKATYLRSGGVDPFYKDHGAYADSDFHKQCWELGMTMIPLDVLELHLHHEKFALTGKLTQREIEIFCLNNYIYYCWKWKLGFRRARQIAFDLKLSECFVKRVRNNLETNFTLSATRESLFVPLLG